MGDAMPVSQHAYRRSSSERAVIQTDIDSMLKKEIIVPSNSPTCRISNEKRSCDAILLQLPRLDDALDRLGSAMFLHRLIWPVGTGKYRFVRKIEKKLRLLLQTDCMSTSGCLWDLVMPVRSNVPWIVC